MGPGAPPDPTPLSAMNGRVHGGQQAVVGATLQLYAVGTSGNASAATPLLTSTVTSGDNGLFSITGDYTCPSSTAQVYIVATGGNPGLAPGTNNPALVMMAALGSCGDLTASQFITINEVTTVAAAWTLAQFAGTYANIGASATNALGIANAFLNANLIVNTATGTIATLPTNLKTETGKIYALADAVASCINSDGGSACTPLFSAATVGGGAAPSNTWDAVMNIVKNPAKNVSGVWAAINAQAPFPTTLTQAPNDWTLSLTVTGEGMSEPTALGVDGEGNVWVASYNGVLSAFNPQGTPLSATGYGLGGVLSNDYGLAIDPNGDVWVSVESSDNYNHGSTTGAVVRFLGASSGGDMGTPTAFQDTTMNYTIGVAADSNGNILVANNSVLPTNGATSITVIDPIGPTYTGFSGTHVGSDIGGATALAPDPSHGIWVVQSVNTVTHLDSSGNTLAVVDCCGEAADALALDSAANVWLATYQDGDVGSVTELGPDATVRAGSITGGGIDHPSGVAVDAAQNVWVTNLDGPGLTELAGNGSSLSPGTVLSPSNGFGLDAHLVQGWAPAVDASGNLWISCYGGNNLVELFGLAAPTKTPQPVTPVAP